MNKLRQLEQDVLAEGREWTRQRLEKRLQEQSDAMPAVCPKTGEGLKDVRWRDLQLMSISGGVNLRVRHGYSPALGQWVCPVRQAWGLPSYQRLKMATRWGSTLLPGTGIVEESNAVGLGGGQGFKVADQFVGGGDALAGGEGQNLLHGGHGGVVNGTGPHLELGLGEGCRSSEKHKEGTHIHLE